MTSGGYLPSRRGNYTPLSPTLRWIIVLVYTEYHTSWITISPKSNFICNDMPTKAILFFFGFSELNNTWLITSELANQSARKVLFTCAVYTYYLLTESEVITGKSQTEVWDFPVMTERTRLISYLLYGFFSAILKKNKMKTRYGFLRRSY